MHIMLSVLLQYDLHTLVESWVCCLIHLCVKLASGLNLHLFSSESVSVVVGDQLQYFSVFFGFPVVADMLVL